MVFEHREQLPADYLQHHPLVGSKHDTVQELAATDMVVDAVAAQQASNTSAGLIMMMMMSDIVIIIIVIIVIINGIVMIVLR